VAKVAAHTDQTDAPTPYQCEVMRTPRDADALLFGGKGSGKTRLVPYLLLRDGEEFGPDCKALYVRQSHAGLAEFALMLYEALARFYGVRGVSFNSQSGLVKFGGRGATCQLDQLAEQKDLAKHWGKNYSLIVCDEVGEANGLDLIDKLRASLRPPLGIPGRMVLIGNPGGPNHATLLRRYVAGTTPWVPRLDPRSGRYFIWCPSTYKDNPHIDQGAYVAQLRAACGNDSELLKAWVDGSWAVAKGGFFASVIDEDRVMTEPWPGIPHDWDVWLAVDHGSAAPGVCQIFCRSPGAYGPDKRYYARGSMVIVDEMASHQVDDLNKGLNWTTAQTCDAIAEMADTWAPKDAPQFRRVPLIGVGDDSMFAVDGRKSIADEYKSYGVALSPARKGSRIAGWTMMKQLLADAGSPDLPGLYVSRRCSYWWSTVPFLPRDVRRPEDLSTTGPDHSADCCRYGLLMQSRRASSRPMWGRDALFSM
jgi:hypothetical protein